MLIISSPTGPHHMSSVTEEWCDVLCFFEIDLLT